MSVIVPPTFLTKAILKLTGAGQGQEQKPNATVQRGDSLSQMMLDRGYSLQELTTKNDKGKTLLDQVASQNGLKNANHLEIGQKLTLPKAKSTKTQTQDKVSISESGRNASKASGQKVTVNKGDSLSQMLMDRGYTTEELLAKDDSGKSMMDRIAAKNGLKNPNLIMPGQQLNLPSKAEKSESKSSVSVVKDIVDNVADTNIKVGSTIGKVLGTITMPLFGGGKIGEKVGESLAKLGNAIFFPGAGKD